MEKTQSRHIKNTKKVKDGLLSFMLGEILGTTLTRFSLPRRQGYEPRLNAKETVQVSLELKKLLLFESISRKDAVFTSLQKKDLIGPTRLQDQ